MLVADLALARRLEAAEALGGLECVQAMMRLRPKAGAAFRGVAGGYAIFLGAGSPLTQALGLGMNSAVSAMELEDLESFYHSRGAPVQIDLCPMADTSLIELLAQRPYRLRGFNSLLVCPLQAPESLYQRVSQVDVRAASPMDSGVWSRTVARGFLENPETSSTIVDEVETIFSMASGTCYLACIGGQPSGGAAMSIRQGLAMFYADSTLPQFRNRGVHTALILERCSRARAAGCELAVSSTVPGSISQKNYERAGFRPVYTKAVLVREWDEGVKG